MSLARSVLFATCLLSVAGLGLLAPRPANAELIGIASNNPGALYSINQATGQSGGLVGLAFDEDNDVLYMNLGSNTTTPNSLFTINTTTGAATLVGANGAVAGQGIDGLAWRSSAVASAAPEPGTFALLALTGLPVAGAVIRRRRAA